MACIVMERQRGPRPAPRSSLCTTGRGYVHTDEAADRQRHVGANEEVARARAHALARRSIAVAFRHFERAHPGWRANGIHIPSERGGRTRTSRSEPKRRRRSRNHTAGMRSASAEAWQHPHSLSHALTGTCRKWCSPPLPFFRNSDGRTGRLDSIHEEITPRRGLPEQRMAPSAQ